MLIEEDITVYEIGQQQWVKYEDFLKAIKDEREACAVLCDQLSNDSRDLRFAAAIRNRKDKE